MATKKQAKSSGAKRGASKGKPGRPSSFNPALIPAIRLLCEKGATDKELAVAFGVTERTITNWKQERPEFFSVLKEAKAEADAEVERSLYERATGYSHEAVKMHVVDGQVVQTTYTEHYPPDATSMIFWLKNRKPAEWRDKTEVDLTVSDRAEVMKAARERAAKR